MPKQMSTEYKSQWRRNSREADREAYRHHVNGGGKQHRLEVGFGQVFYRWLKKNDYPEGYQVLCHNCNLAKGFYGTCPHQR